MKLKQSIYLLSLIIFSMFVLSSCQKSKTNKSNSEKTTKIGYIHSFSKISGNFSFSFDEIEWVTLEDKARIKELNLNTSDDMPNGFYINNPTPDSETYNTNDKTEYKIIDPDKGGEPTKVELDKFIDHLGEFQNLYWIVIDNDIVVSITEQYLP